MSRPHSNYLSQKLPTVLSTLYVILNFCVAPSYVAAKTEINVLFVEDSPIFQKTYERARNIINKGSEYPYFINEDTELICTYGYQAIDIYRKYFDSDKKIHLIILDINMCSFFLNNEEIHEKDGVHLAMFLRGNSNSLYNYCIVRCEGGDCFLGDNGCNIHIKKFLGPIVTASDEPAHLLVSYLGENTTLEQQIFSKISPKIKNHRDLNCVISKYFPDFSHAALTLSEEKPDNLKGLICLLGDMQEAFSDSTPNPSDQNTGSKEIDNRVGNEFLSKFRNEITDLIHNEFPDHFLTNETFDEIIALTEFYEDTPMYSISNKDKRINFIWHPPNRQVYVSYSFISPTLPPPYIVNFYRYFP